MYQSRLKVNFNIPPEPLALTRYINSLKEFMEQLQVFNDSTPKVGTERSQKSVNSLISALYLISISQINTQVWVRSFQPFLNYKQISSNRRSHSDQSGEVLRMLKLYCFLIKKNEIIFSPFSSDFLTNHYQCKYNMYIYITCWGEKMIERG